MLAQGLAWGSSGNLSLKLSDHSCVMTATGSRLGQLTAVDLPIVSFAADGRTKTLRLPAPLRKK